MSLVLVQTVIKRENDQKFNFVAKFGESIFLTFNFVHKTRKPQVFRFIIYRTISNKKRNLYWLFFFKLILYKRNK